MRTETTSQQARNPVPPAEGVANQPRAAKTSSRKSSPVAEVQAQPAKSEKAFAREQQPRQRKEEKTGRRPVRFSFRSPEARSVAVAGSFNGWQPATRLTQRDGQWTADIELEPGTYEYRFVVDGQWMEDPAASAHATNPYGGRNSVLKV